jgi:hypothetical protein
MAHNLRRQVITQDRYKPLWGVVVRRDLVLFQNGMEPWQKRTSKHFQLVGE